MYPIQMAVCGREYINHLCKLFACFIQLYGKYIYISNTTHTNCNAKMHYLFNGLMLCKQGHPPKSTLIHSLSATLFELLLPTKFTFEPIIANLTFVLL